MKICILPLAQRSHLFTTLDLGKTLLKLGHEVHYHALQRDRGVVESSGVKYFPYVSDAISMEIEGYWNGLIDRAGETRIASNVLNPAPFLKALRLSMLRDLDRHLSSHKPDLLLVDATIIYPLVVCAERRGIPSALMWSMFPNHLSYFRYFRKGGFFKHLRGLARDVRSRYSYVKWERVDKKNIAKEIRKFVRQNNWSVGAEQISNFSRRPGVVLSSEALDFPRRPKREHFYVSCNFAARKEQGDPISPSSRKPVIYCSFGSMGFLYSRRVMMYKKFVDVLAQHKEWQGILALGPGLSSSDLAPIPENVTCREWVPQLEVLQKASAMIHHGGLGSINECIAFGVPMVSIAMRYEQHFNTDRVGFHKLGLRADAYCSPGSLGRMIEEVITNPVYKKNVLRMREKTKASSMNSEEGQRIVKSFLEKSLNQLIPLDWGKVNPKSISLSASH